MKIIEREKQSFSKLVKYIATLRGLFKLCCDLFSHLEVLLLKSIKLGSFGGKFSFLGIGYIEL